MSERGTTDEIVENLLDRTCKAITGSSSEPLYGVAIHPEDLMHLTFYKKDVDGWEDMDSYVSQICDLLIVSSTAVEPGELLFLTEEEWDLNVEAGHIEEVEG